MRDGEEQRPCRILLVDDSESYRTALSKLLSREKMSTSLEKPPTDALRSSPQNTPRCAHHGRDDAERMDGVERFCALTVQCRRQWC